MPDNPQQKIDQPKGAMNAPEPTTGAQAIFVMPERYRGGKEQMVEAKLKEPPKKPVPAPPAPPPPPKPPMAAASVQKPPAKKKRGLGTFAIVGFLLVVGLAVGGYFLLQSREEPPAPTTPTPTTPTPTTPTPTTPTPTTPGPTEPTPSATRPGLDSDSDGLTDAEERFLYQTDPLRPDTDGDGFLDSIEVFHGYNPGGTAPETLAESGLVQLFENNRFVILFPSVWTAEADPEDPNAVNFVSTTGEMIRVTREARGSTETLAAWHASRHPGESVTPVQTKNGYDSLVVTGQLTQYVADTDAILTFRYDAGARGTIEYLTTFRMMANNLVWKP